MSRFFSEKYRTLVPYVPGEQPKDMQYIKLNTNESPYPVPQTAQETVAREVEKLQLYPDPDGKELTDVIAELCSVKGENVLLTNGSDETLNFAFMAFCDREHPAAFADITYGFYSVFADLHGIPYEEIPLKQDLSIDANDYIGIGKTIFIANPNAPTGLALPVSDIEKIVRSNPQNVVVVDEAYVDFGGETVIPLTKKYDNLLVVRTFSKSRSMAGARLGFAVGAAELISDLHTLRYSTNPYNVNRLTMGAALATLKNDAYNMENCKTIAGTRDETAKELKKLGFEATDSKTNFLFAKHKDIGGKELYLKLKQRGILVRHFDKERIRDYNRITVGTPAQMQILIETIKSILEEQP